MHIRFTEESWRALKAARAPGPIQMLNLIRLHEDAVYADGQRASGHDAYRAYSRLSATPAAAVGMRIVWRGELEVVAIGPPAERWDLCFIAEYPSADAFVALMRDPEYQAAMVHRQAAVADCRLIRLSPLPAGDTFLHE